MAIIILPMPLNVVLLCFYVIYVLNIFLNLKKSVQSHLIQTTPTMILRYFKIVVQSHPGPWGGDFVQLLEF